MDGFESLVLHAEKVREHGDPQRALEIFASTLSWGLPPAEVSIVFCHMGQCKEHLGHVILAEENYAKALEKARDSKNGFIIARALRHLVSIRMRQGRYGDALDLGKEAWRIYQDYSAQINQPIPANSVWIVHGIVKTLIDGKYSPEAIRHWTKLEFHYLAYALQHEPESFRKAVWLTGWLADAAYAWKPWSLPLYLLGGVIAVATGQGIRVKQFATVRR